MAHLERKLIAHVMVPLAQRMHILLTTHTPHVLIKLVLLFFYALCAQENLQIYSADASNEFAESPASKQIFYCQVDNQFRDWWTNYLGNPPIPPNPVLCVLRALQGHPELSRMWSRHIH